MTAIAVMQTPKLDAPVEVEAIEGGLTVRWEGTEVTLLGDADELQHYLEALQFCYETGYEDASNPRLFVP